MDIAREAFVTEGEIPMTALAKRAGGSRDVVSSLPNARSVGNLYTNRRSSISHLLRQRCWQSTRLRGPPPSPDVESRQLER